ncbi:long-chain fatty acid--CoA ligase [Shewanella avicenniae]|uniref:Long-chain fatty acid--CoA ligase n=1 Tax=Shewanella avicenniae TaxID=2814294 RepID=A0ABX7QQ64_9GAMM|nr:long-chain fatty acid--CoA ligase [Shewanella avicenniae]QSX33612.1 long-chain fatty acid--CoA ligase [Shewanella avicenniae]
MSLAQYQIVKLLEQQVKQQPDNIALEGFEMASPWDKVSWTQFKNYSDQLAAAFIDHGLAVQDRVAILSNNCPQWSIVDIATNKARGVLVPIYPTSTLEQAVYILRDSGAKVLCVTNQAQYQMACKLQPLCPALQQVIVFDNDVQLKSELHFHLDTLLSEEAGVTHPELQQRLAESSLDDLLTLIYTSGTTGDPKGVMLDQRNVASAMRQHHQRVPFEQGDVSLVFLPLSHVYERGWSYYVMSRGGRNVYLADTPRVQQAIAAVKPHTVCVVPRFLEKVYSAVIDKVNKGPASRRKLFAWAISVGQRQFEADQGRAKGSLLLKWQWLLANKLVYSKLHNALGGRIKYMPCGGAALDADVGAFFAAINIPLLVGYGMTETTATVACCSPDNRVKGANGLPLDEVEVRLGKDDEILVRGETVMRGYFNRPLETAEAFEDGWLKTGDVGRIDENGNLFITDRLKELMKTSNGKYIAPQRVEGKVGCCPLIEQVAIIADARNYVTALIVPAFEALESWAKQKGLNYDSPIELIRNTQVVAHFEERLKQLQHELAGFEQIKKFTLLPEAFSMEAGLITPTLKLRRKMIYSKYANEINAMYNS